MHNKWQKIWSSREICEPDNQLDNRLEQLLRLDGMDTGFGNVNHECWQQYVNDIIKHTGINLGSRVFEVGCGAGAFLYPIYKQKISVSGSDYSSILIQLASRFMPHGNFQKTDAADAILNSYTHVLSSGVFLYFPTLPYAEKVLSQMIAASSNIIAILDIPDKDKQLETEISRRKLYTGKDYEAHYADLKHLYYDKEWFIEKLETMGCYDIEIKNQFIKGYKNARYRFNVFAKT